MDGWTGYDCSLYRGEEITFSYKRHAGRSLGGYPEYVKFNRPEEMDKPIDPALAAIGEELNDWLLDWATENEAEAMVFFEETGVHLLNAAKEEREIPEASARIVEDSQLDVSFRYSGCPSMCKTCVGDFDNNFDVECTSCVTNATPIGFPGAGTGVHDGCACDAGWTGRTCDYWNGPCDPMCLSCVGPGPANCIACTYGAARGEGGYCECLPGRYTLNASYPCAATQNCNDHCADCTFD
jgi:hypothetical protein